MANSMNTLETIAASVMVLKMNIWKKLKMKRIKHNDLTHYFLRPHSELPRAYLASCEEFFKRIKKTPAAPYKNFFWPTIPQRQATSTKRQATSLTMIKYRIIKDI